MEVDALLLARARCCVNASNVHRLKTLMFCYEEAVVLYNSGHPRHLRYDETYEYAQREFVTAAELARHVRNRAVPESNAPTCRVATPELSLYVRRSMKRFG